MKIHVSAGFNTFCFFTVYKKNRTDNYRATFPHCLFITVYLFIVISFDALFRLLFWKL